ncbi:polysaccharide deacetylase family protein [Acuticoccus kandeliae]|uniref:polysaccharide deacetylase family protein n=1 Tax=Acuticoccus kandeliae TaxID=2073160 RepID=UPI000D3E6F08|nr:polysaccharide deacetylase family protein [Acuticoccus kandeliae]
MKRLTFSFDNGPEPGATEPLLDFLRERSIKATFFVVGDRLDAAGLALARRAHREGHWIGNHTLSHGTPLGREGDAARVAREIGETERLIGPLAHPDRLFRPNGAGALGPHLLSPAAVAYLAANRYTVITWNNVPGDFRPPHEAWLETALATLDAQDWSLLVLHDPFIARMLDRLARFCDALEARGIAIVQSFPPSCILMERGVATPELAACVTPASGVAPAEAQPSHPSQRGQT